MHNRFIGRASVEMDPGWGKTWGLGLADGGKRGQCFEYAEGRACSSCPSLGVKRKAIPG